MKNIGPRCKSYKINNTITSNHFKSSCIELGPYLYIDVILNNNDISAKIERLQEQQVEVGSNMGGFQRKQRY